MLNNLTKWIYLYNKLYFNVLCCVFVDFDNLDST